MKYLCGVFKGGIVEGTIGVLIFYKIGIHIFFVPGDNLMKETKLKKVYIMSNEIIYLTAEGMNKLKEELHHMVSVERPAAAAAIAEARDKGDLSENAEYDAAREAQGLLEMRIAQLEHTLSKARIIDETKIDTSKVQILSRVKLLNHNVKREVEYTIVSENEANLREGKLAIGTPIAKALLGKKVGEIVEVQVPAGMLKLEILNISI